MLDSNDIFILNRLNKPQFAHRALTVQAKKKPELLTIDKIIKLDKEYIKVKQR